VIFFTVLVFFPVLFFLYVFLISILLSIDAVRTKNKNKIRIYPFLITIYLVPRVFKVR
jgi:hypothetical protein